MKELYWITVLGNISTVSCVIAIITFACAIIFLGAYFLYVMDEDDTKKGAFAAFKSFFITAAITGLIAIFTPSSKELLFIYGVGSTIDYVQSNEEAKQLPDKAVKALNLWADDYLKGNKTNEITD